MTDLSDFGVDVEDPASNEPAEASDDASTSRQYRNGRCPAITTDGRRRCAAPVSRMKDADGYCGTHGRQHDPWSIHSDPETLILLTGRIDALSLSDVAPEAVDFDLDAVRNAVHAIHGLEERPLTVTEDGLELPQRFAEASRLIVRTPVKTVDSRLKGEYNQRQLVQTVRPGDWDPDYLDGEGRTAEIRNDECLPGEDSPPKVGLLVEGGEQHWFPVDIQDGDRDD